MSSSLLLLSSRLLSPFREGRSLQPFRLLKQDFRNLRSRYVSDWTVFNQLVVASAVYVFFTNILPGSTFVSDLCVLTGQSWGTIEVVLSTGLCGLIFSVFSAQLLTIFGVTGPFSILAENRYKLCTENFHAEFLPVMAWSPIHSAWIHYLLAIFNAHDWTMGYVTSFSADIFSLLNSVIYFYKAAMELKRTHDNVPFDAFLYAIIGAFGSCFLAIFLATTLKWKPLFGRIVRTGLAEYAAAISIILWIGIPYIGELANLDHQRLAVQASFRPTNPNRNIFFVRFWEVPLPSIICTLDRYGTKKPGGYAWDIALLGTTTALCGILGILGIPPANGLLPQAPLHSESLRHWVHEPLPSDPDVTDTTITAAPRLVSRAYEQSYSACSQAALILVFVSPSLQRLLGLAPTSVLAGLFLSMGYESLSVNPILPRAAHMATPPSELPPLPTGVTWPSVHVYTALQIVMTGVIFGVKLTVAVPGFPIIIIILVPVRLLVMNRIWSRETLRFVDGWACREGRPEDEDITADGVELIPRYE
ncbi:HCO3 transporter family-domain-containing protein [Lasiosphaeris hirsuta]|uniref:HCO3 transporter family-domain-containing protein n=1 Tax=Lasiosphaeris hirsuta TaxID=260670 RepID=A0AA40B8X9_9PEZI|nr:HCO3 transporter family-domain-containing protein [Lasiosphaeris hirsuta]